MKQKHILTASGMAVAMALGVLSTSCLAQDYPSSADNPGQLRPDYELQPSDSLQPRGAVEEPGAEIRTPSGLGAQGPIRSDDPTLYQDAPAPATAITPSYPRNTAQADYEMARQRGERGYMGFLQWQQRSSNSP